jgi:hypothetical protein
VVVALLYIVFGIIGKFSAVFIAIPYPVLGGALMTMYGMFTGVVLSNLQHVSLTSNRNLAIIGSAIFIGLMVPYWIELNPKAIHTGTNFCTRAWVHSGICSHTINEIKHIHIVHTLSSNRNLDIISSALFIGPIVPYWIDLNPKAIHTHKRVSAHVHEGVQSRN